MRSMVKGNELGEGDRRQAGKLIRYVNNALWCLLKNLHLPGGSVVKNLPAMPEVQVGPWDQKEPLEKEMATHSGILPGKISWTEEPGRLKSWT